MTTSTDIRIFQAKTKEDCVICDEFLSKLIKYESMFDSSIMSNIKINGLCQKNLQHDGIYIAYAKSEKPVGYIFGYLQNPKGKIRNTNVLILEALYVEKECRNQGVGKMLLKSFEEWAKKTFNNDYVIEITYINSNENAEKFYKSMGYSAVKTTLRK